jgi:alpha-glucosidase
VLNPYGAAAVGEVGDSQRGLEIMAEYTSGGDKVQMCYPFELLQPAPADRRPAGRNLRPHGGPRPTPGPAGPIPTTTWCATSPAGAWTTPPRGLCTCCSCLRGSVCLYQGEELGLPEAELAFEDLQDPYGIEFWPEFKGRDGCRTPMVWDHRQRGRRLHHRGAPLAAGQGPAHRPLAVAAQGGEGMLAHYRRALAFRRAHPALRDRRDVRSSAVGDGGAASPAAATSGSSAPSTLAPVRRR